VTVTKPKFDAFKLKATINNVEYRWVGGFGTVIESWERGVKRGDVRMIGNVVFFARTVDWKCFTSRVAWCPQEDVDAEWLRDCRAAIFC